MHRGERICRIRIIITIMVVALLQALRLRVLRLRARRLRHLREVEVEAEEEVVVAGVVDKQISIDYSIYEYEYQDFVFQAWVLYDTFDRLTERL